MPIRVEYTPNLNSIANAAFLAGAGEYRQRQQQIGMQQQRLAQQREADQARLALSAEQMRQRQDRDMFDREYRMRQSEALEQHRAQEAMMRQQAFENDLKQQGLSNKMAQHRAELYEQQLRLQDPALAAQRRWDEESAEVADKVGSDIEQITSNMHLNPDGQKKRRELIAWLNALRGQRGTISPSEYNKKFSQWMDKYDEANLEGYVVPELTMEQRFQKGDAYKIPGHSAIMTQDKDGVAKISKIDPDEQTGTPLVRLDAQGNTIGVPMGEYYGGRTEEAAEALEDARKQLMDEAKGNVGEDGTLKPPTPEQIMERLQQNYQLRQMMAGMPAPKKNEEKSSEELADELLKKMTSTALDEAHQAVGSRVRFNPSTGQFE